MGIEAELELPEIGLKRTLKDLFAGAVGGVAQVLLGMSNPPTTSKSRDRFRLSFSMTPILSCIPCNFEFG